MTLPASGQIGLDNVATETGQGASNISMSWVRSVTKTSIGGSVNVVNSFSDLYNKAYYQNNTQGNCNNGNCTSNCNCGNIQCSNCVITGTVNCANCDGTSYIQPNCNCACTYNCNYGATSYNCNCACACIACACACSDPSLKENVEPITGALDMIDELSGVTWAWNNEALYYGKNPGQRAAGLMAPDVKRVVPGAVFDFNGKQSVRYINENEASVVGYLVETIKELKQQVKDLQSRKN